MHEPKSIGLAMLNAVAGVAASGFSLLHYTLAEPARIGQCQFFANNKVSCVGKLRCKPSDATENQPIDNACPGAMEQSNGTWNANQGVIRRQFLRVPSSPDLIATCDFYTNSSFNCVSGNPVNKDYWEGAYTGSLNAAFELGLDKWWFLQRTTTTTTTTTTETPHRPSYVQDVEGDNQETVVVERTTKNIDKETESEDDNLRMRNYGDSGSENTENEVDQNGSADRQGRRRPYTAGGSNYGDDHAYGVHYSVRPRNIVICEFFTNGEVGCRNCTEKIQQLAQIRRDYNCTNPPNGPVTKKWSSDNGIVPLTPDFDAAPKVVAATCIFEGSTSTYECHGSSVQCPDEQAIETNRCLSGKRWNGEYSGSFDFLIRSV